MTEKEGQGRRSVILFWVHLGLAALIVAGFVYSMSHR